MATDRYIAALEISSSKVIGAIGALGKSGQLEILAVEQEKCTDSVRFGHIQNIEETPTLINFVLERLERRPNIAPREITGVYVGLSGRSLRSIEKEVSLNLPDDTEITDALLERLKSKALEAEIDSSLAIVDAIPRVFTVDRHETHRPKGRMGSHISAIYDLIVARPDLSNKLKKVVSDKLGLDIKGIVVTAIATAEVALNEHEKKLGCMLVDIGAETTSVTIYTRGNLVYYSTIPLGGRNITLDLKALNVIEDKAEELKVTFGHAIAPSVPSHESIGGIPLAKINNYVVARAEEMVANIAEQLRYAGLSEKDIPEGIVVCGGGSKLNGMADLIGKFTGMKVRKASYPSFIRVSDPNGQGLECLEVSSIMYEATKRPDDDDCLQIPAAQEPADDTAASQPLPEPEPEETHKKRRKGKGLFGNLGEALGRIFTPIGEDDEGDELS